MGLARVCGGMSTASRPSTPSRVRAALVALGAGSFAALLVAAAVVGVMFGVHP